MFVPVKRAKGLHSDTHKTGAHSAISLDAGNMHSTDQRERAGTREEPILAEQGRSGTQHLCRTLRDSDESISKPYIDSYSLCDGTGCSLA